MEGTVARGEGRALHGAESTKRADRAGSNLRNREGEVTRCSRSDIERVRRSNNPAVTFGVRLGGRLAVKRDFLDTQISPR